MSLETLSKLAPVERCLVSYVGARIGPSCGTRLADHLTGYLPFEEDIDGEKTSIQVWAQEEFGIGIRF